MFWPYNTLVWECVWNVCLAACILFNRSYCIHLTAWSFAETIRNWWRLLCMFSFVVVGFFFIIQFFSSLLFVPEGPLCYCLQITSGKIDCKKKSTVFVVNFFVLLFLWPVIIGLFLYCSLVLTICFNSWVCLAK
jgi:hypothetical protein